MVGLKSACVAGQLSEPIFIQLVHNQFHWLLFKYAQEIEATDIVSIKIEDARIAMTTLANGIGFIIDPSDHRAAPVEA